MARTVPRAIQLATKALQIRNAKQLAWSLVQGKLTAMIARYRAVLSAAVLAQIQAITGRIAIPGLAQLAALSNSAAATILTVASMYKSALGTVNIPGLGPLSVPINNVIDRLVAQYGQTIDDIAADLVSNFQVSSDQARRIAEAWANEQQHDLLDELRQTFNLPDLPLPSPPTFGR